MKNHNIRFPDELWERIKKEVKKLHPAIRNNGEFVREAVKEKISK